MPTVLKGYQSLSNLLKYAEDRNWLSNPEIVSGGPIPKWVKTPDMSISIDENSEIICKGSNPLPSVLEEYERALKEYLILKAQWESETQNDIPVRWTDMIEVQGMNCTWKDSTIHALHYCTDLSIGASYNCPFHGKGTIIGFSREPVMWDTIYPSWNLPKAPVDPRV